MGPGNGKANITEAHGCCSYPGPETEGVLVVPRRGVVSLTAFFSSGGPEITVFAYHDSGNVQSWSFGFLIASVLGFAIHLPFLDRAEKRRKDILTGGTAPAWYGPA